MSRKTKRNRHGLPQKLMAFKSGISVIKDLDTLLVNVQHELCLGKVFTLDFSEKKHLKKVFDLLEEMYKKHNICVGLLNDDRLDFLPPTTGLYATIVGLDCDTLECSFIGRGRFELLDLDQLGFDEHACAHAKIRLLEDREIRSNEKEEVDNLRMDIDRCMTSSPIGEWDWVKRIFTESPGALADKMVASEALYELVDVQAIFYTLDPISRLRVARNRILTLAEDVERDMDDGVFGDPQDCDASSRGNESDFEKRFKEVRKFMLPELADVVEGRLRERYGGYGRNDKVETYLRNVLGMPWGKIAEDPHRSISKIRKQLDDDHYGLNEPKEKILEFLAVRLLNPKNKGSIMCLLGPPGVGKTSLGQSLGKEEALNRPWVRISVGGVHDEPTIRGHSYTYEGSGTGMIMRAIKQSGVMNPIILIDEVDKISENGGNGNAAAALLEVLDPLQNNSFVDHYFGGPVDLSGVFFILTGNDLMKINPILRDRLHVVEIESYDMFEKLQIAKNFLVPKQIKSCGVEKALSFTDEALDILIQEYTHESGVRELERKIESICAKRARIVVETQTFGHLKIDSQEVVNILGPPKFIRDFSRVTLVGCCNGLATTGHVGILTMVETQLISRGRAEVFTGVGDKIKDSVEKALSLLERMPTFKDKIKQCFSEGGIHFNMGDGNIDADGPSAGIAILCALYSLFSEKPVREKLAMTGAIGLTMGDVGEVGGIKEKVIGAMGAGINELILPAHNRSHFEKIDKRIKDKFKKVHFVKSTNEVLEIVFGEEFRRL